MLYQKVFGDGYPILILHGSTVDHRHMVETLIHRHDHRILLGTLLCVDPSLSSVHVDTSLNSS